MLCLQDVLATSEVTGSCWLLDSCPGFEFFQLNIMAGPSKKMCVSDEMFFMGPIDRASPFLQLSRFHLQTETESSLQNFVF
jgi:hypothetical protein